MINFLLEIGTEEIPDWMIPGALDQLSKLVLYGCPPYLDATPRRLVVRAEGLPDRTEDEIKRIPGPPISAGENAAEGFAKKNDVDRLAITRSGDYFELQKKIPGRFVREVLAELLPTTILGIQWPKTMYWTGGKTGPRFIRPIRWIVADPERRSHPVRNRWDQIHQHHARPSSARIVVDSGDDRELRRRTP